jgi:hypothetical protein
VAFAALQALHLPANLAVDLSRVLHLLLVEYVLAVLAGEILVGIALDVLGDFDIADLLELALSEESLSVHHGYRLEALVVGAFEDFLVGVIAESPEVVCDA